MWSKKKNQLRTSSAFNQDSSSRALKTGGSTAGISCRGPLPVGAQACWSPLWIKCPELWLWHCFRSEEVAQWGECLLCHNEDQHPHDIRVRQEEPVTLAHKVEGTQTRSDPWRSLRSNLQISGLSKPMKWSSSEDDTDLASSLHIFWYTHANTRTSTCIQTQQKKKM